MTTTRGGLPVRILGRVVPALRFATYHDHLARQCDAPHCGGKGRADYTSTSGWYYCHGCCVRIMRMVLAEGRSAIVAARKLDPRTFELGDE